MPPKPPLRILPGTWVGARVRPANEVTTSRSGRPASPCASATASPVPPRMRSLRVIVAPSCLKSGPADKIAVAVENQDLDRHLPAGLLLGPLARLVRDPVGKRQARGHHPGKN